MSTYTLTAYTVEPTDDGQAYTWDVMGARRTTKAADVVNVDELRHAMLVAALDHYDAAPDTTPAVHVTSRIAKGRNVANYNRAASLYAKAPALADRSAKRRAMIESLTADLPAGQLTLEGVQQ